jgi:hypothetical protein
MKLRLLRLFSGSSLLVLTTCIVQFNDPAQANGDLLHPQKGNVVEAKATVINGAEGIELRAVTPEQPIEIPEEGKSEPIKLGLRITNTSLVEREILLAPGLPVLFTMSQPPKKIVGRCDSIGFRFPSQEELFKILKPGESIEIFDKPIYLQQQNGEISIKYRTITASTCSFNGLQPGRYSVVIHHNGYSASEAGISLPGELILLKSKTD